MTSMVFGIYIGLTNFILTILCLKLIPKLGFENAQTQKHFTALAISVCCLYNSVLFPAIFVSTKKLNSSYFQFITYYEKSFYVGMMTTSSLSYMSPILGYLISKVFKKKPPKSALRYPIEQRYALYLNTISVCFFYGIYTPPIFIFGALSFSVQYIVDVLLITYWYEQDQIIDAQLNNDFLEGLKYVPLVITVLSFSRIP